MKAGWYLSNPGESSMSFKPVYNPYARKIKNAQAMIENLAEIHKENSNLHGEIATVRLQRIAIVWMLLGSSQEVCCAVPSP